MTGFLDIATEDEKWLDIDAEEGRRRGRCPASRALSASPRLPGNPFSSSSFNYAPEYGEVSKSALMKGRGLCLTRFPGYQDLRKRSAA